MKKLILFLSLLSIFVLLPTAYGAQMYFQDDFEYSDSIGNHGWGSPDSNIEQMSSGGLNNSGCIRVRYDHKGTPGYWLGVNVSALNLSDIYVRFYFKRTSWVEGGCKFLKIFGKSNDPQGYANTSFQLNYSGGDLFEVSYGAGYAYANDTQSVIRYRGDHSDESVVVHTSKGTFDPPDDRWVCFEAHIKYNTNGNRDGEYQVWIDGTLWLNATNIVNRNDANSQYIRSVDLANYTHPWSDTWYLWYDSIVISDSYIGPLDVNAGDPPPTEDPPPAEPTMHEVQ